VSDAPGGLRACVAAFVRATVRKAPGGYLVEEGMWSFNSGIHHAKWDILPMPLVDDAGNVVDHAFALVPVEQIEIRDDWNVIGLQGTGSASVVARNVFVPDEHVVSASAVLDGRAQRSSSFGGPLYRAASMPVLTISLLFPILGAARRAFELYMERLPTRMIYGLNERQIESSTVHARIGEISAKIDAAGLVVRDDAERIDHAANGTEYMAPLERVRIRRDIGYAVQLVTEAIDALASLYGGSAAREDDEMGRIWRDIRVALLHGGVSPSAGTELHGRLQAGQPGKFAMV
jgi:3-hydroxy-9,10-secoandrosta-1,3,5(10)-triene-9,17-dione monooxygenase